MLLLYFIAFSYIPERISFSSLNAPVSLPRHKRIYELLSAGCALYFHTQLFQFFLRLFIAPEKYRMYDESGCRVQIGLHIIKKHTFFRLQSIPFQQKAVNSGIRIYNTVLIGKDPSVQIFQEIKGIAV